MNKPHLHWLVYSGYNPSMTLFAHQKAALQQVAQNGIFHMGASGMGKSNLTMHTAMQVLNNGGSVIWLNGETFSSSEKTNTPVAPHNPDHTPLQCLAEGVRRVAINKNNLYINPIFLSAYLIREIGGECDVIEVNFKTHSEVIGRARKSDRWSGSRKTEKCSKTLLKTSLGFIDSMGQSAATLGDLLKRYGAPGRYSVGHVHAQTLDHFIGKDHDRILFRHLAFYDRARDEIELAWIESHTPKSSAEPTVRRV